MGESTIAVSARVPSKPTSHPPISRRENSRRNKDGRMVVRDILFHTVWPLSPEAHKVSSGDRDHIHSVEQNIFHLPWVGPLGRQITSPPNECFWQKWGMFLLKKIQRERGSHRHTSFGLQQGMDAKTNHRKGKCNCPLLSVYDREVHTYCIVCTYCFVWVGDIY